MGDPTKRIYDDIISFHKMREKCRERGKEIQVGYVQGEAALLKLSLPEAENKQWKWRDPKTNKGKIVRDNWLSGERWLEIVESPPTALEAEVRECFVCNCAARQKVTIPVARSQV